MLKQPPFFKTALLAAACLIGAEALTKAAPDGYTLGVATVSTMATNPAANALTPYDPLKDFTPITNLVNVPNVLTVNPKTPAKTLQEFIALLKSQPSTYSYAPAGTGSISHLDGELFKSLTGTDMIHVPYRGSGPALNNTLACPTWPPSPKRTCRPWTTWPGTAWWIPPACRPPSSSACMARP